MGKGTAFGKTIIRLKSLVVRDRPIPSIMMPRANGRRTSVRMFDSMVVGLRLFQGKYRGNRFDKAS